MPGQTLSEIRALLASAGLRPQHRLGQNFLIDLNLMRKLVEAAAAAPGDVVLEVGPGTGSLTECLLARGATVLAVEIDRGLQRVLEQRFAGEAGFTLVCEDVLQGKHRVHPRVLDALRERPPAPSGARKLVSNLPYQIATPLLVDLLAGQPPFERMVCTIQKEVGDRLQAGAADDAYGPVSVLMHTFARVETLAALSPHAFWPRPKVDSVMLRITPHAEGEIPAVDFAPFAAFVHAAFRHRRKMLRSAIRGLDGAADLLRSLEQCEISPTSRPEELSPAQWRRWFRDARRLPA